MWPLTFVRQSSRKVPLLFDFSHTLLYSAVFSKQIPNVKFHENLSSWNRVVVPYGQTDGERDEADN